MKNISYQDKFDLVGNVAVVTGGAGIIGQHFCAGLAESGSKVAVVDLQEEKAQELAQTLSEKYDNKVIGVGCDVTKVKSVKAMVMQVVAELGEINILHNNAAGKSDDLDAFFAPFEEYSIDQWRQITAVNLDGMFLVAQAVGKQMVSQGKGGSIIQTASIYGIMGPDHRIYEGQPFKSFPGYSASKAGVIGLTKWLATWWGGNIRVNCVTPGGVFNQHNEDFVKAYSNRVPMGRMAEREELVGIVLYLFQDRGQKFQRNTSCNLKLQNI